MALIGLTAAETSSFVHPNDPSIKLNDDGSVDVAASRANGATVFTLRVLSAFTMASIENRTNTMVLKPDGSQQFTGSQLLRQTEIVRHGVVEVTNLLDKDGGEIKLVKRTVQNADGSSAEVLSDSTLTAIRPYLSAVAAEIEALAVVDPATVTRFTISSKG